MPKSTKKTTKRRRTTLKDLPATPKEMSKKEKQRVGGKALAAPFNTVGAQFTVTINPAVTRNK